MIYHSLIAARFRRDFRRLPDDVQAHVLTALDIIVQDPYKGEKMKAVEVGEWKYRVGDYRIRYDIEGQDVIFVVVRHRREVYRS